MRVTRSALSGWWQCCHEHFSALPTPRQRRRPYGRTRPACGLLFYEKIRRDSVLGPIFEEAIGQDWGPHIERIVQFG
jgi:hypothetical protein